MKTYSFHQLGPKELNVGKEDWRRYPEDPHSLGLIHLGRVITIQIFT